MSHCFLVVNDCPQLTDSTFAEEASKWTKLTKICQLSLDDALTAVQFQSVGGLLILAKDLTCKVQNLVHTFYLCNGFIPSSVLIFFENLSSSLL